MKCKVIFCFLFVISACITTNAQSVYRFTYNFHNEHDSVTYYAFFIRFENGNAIARVRFESARDKKLTLVEITPEQADIRIGKDSMDENRALFRPSKAKIIIGDISTPFTLPAFLFTANKTPGFMEPGAVVSYSINTDSTVMDKRTYFEWKLISSTEMDKDLMSQFFTSSDELYRNFFRMGQKGFSDAEKNTKMILLVVTNTNEPTIGAACANDRDRAVQTFASLASFIGLSIDSTIISGDHYNKRNVEAAIKKIRISSPNDIIVFYYSGHGFRKPGIDRPFPFIDLRANPSQNYLAESKNIQDIYDAIRKKGARLNIVLSDCCNCDVVHTNSVGSKPLTTKESGVKWSEDNCRQLFFNQTPISILATAARSGERASCNYKFGGFFSYFFKSSMENYCSILKSNVSWYQVLGDTQIQTLFKAKRTWCEDAPCQQYPEYKVDLGRE